MTKDKVLSILKSREGEFVSGEELARNLELSRMSINKAVRSLQDEGFVIDAVPRKGYRLVMADVYNGRAIEAALSPLRVFFHDAIEGSSNNVAKRLADEVEGPFVVVCKSQDGGRGRLGRRFCSPEGGVYFSLVLPSELCGDVDLITTRAALAAAEAIEDVTGIKTAIKWVNDVYAGGRKCVGILTEGIVNLELGGLDKVIIGTGINLNTTAEDYPEELRGTVTSLRDEAGGRMFSRLEMVTKAVKRTIELQKEDFLEAYRSRCFVLGKDIFVIKGDERREAYAVDVDEKAHLVVRYPDGREESLSSAEVSLRIRENG